LIPDDTKRTLSMGNINLILRKTTKNNMAALSRDSFEYWGVDYRSNEIVIITTDGRRVTHPITPIPNNPIASSWFDWEKWWVISETIRGDHVIAEAYSPLSTDKGRPSVYLDQNHWSQLAWSIVDPSKTRKKGELDAARRLVELATDAGIVLPLSAAHLTEIGPLFQDKRYHLGLAMAKFSGGWEMRHPIKVLGNEVYGALARIASAQIPQNAQSAVVTLEPQAYSFADPRASVTQNDMELLQSVILEPATILAYLVKSDPRTKYDHSNWVLQYSRINEYFRNAPLKKRDKRMQAFAFFWSGYRDTVGRASEKLGLFHMTFQEVLAHLYDQIQSMPFASYLSELHQLRYLDASYRWKSNDLVDITYLSCAAAYCDYVVAERHTGTQLRQIMTNRKTEPNTFITLSDLVSALERDNVKTASERGIYF